MKCWSGQPRVQGVTLLELLCVISIIIILASMLLGPAGRILKRVRADQWSEQASFLLEKTVHQLNAHFQGRQDFPLQTLEILQNQGLLGSAEIGFLKDSRVTFMPFAGADPDDKVVIQVQLKRGFWNEAGLLMERKEAITRVPQ